MSLEGKEEALIGGSLFSFFFVFGLCIRSFASLAWMLFDYYLNEEQQFWDKDDKILKAACRTFDSHVWSNGRQIAKSCTTAPSRLNEILTPLKNLQMCMHLSLVQHLRRCSEISTCRVCFDG